MEIKTTNDCILLQNSLVTLLLWCNINRLFLNVNKHKVMRYTNSRSLVQYNYNLDGILLETVNQFKDLGVIFDTKLKFQNHIKYVKNKSLTTLGFILD